ncbi:M28 family metallopeptidase [Clostridium sp. DL1XJH146]
MINQFKRIIICFILFMLSFSYIAKLSIKPFDTNSVLNNIEYLSSDYFNGRLAGSIENREVQKFLELQFEDKGLLPFHESYNQSFLVKYPVKVDGEPNLSVQNSSCETIKTYEYCEDYKEDMLSFRKNEFQLDKNNKMYIQDTNIQFKKDMDYFLIHSLENDKLNFRSSFIASSDFSMCIMVTSKTLEELKSYITGGYSIKCNIPYNVSDTEVSNVIGMIEGSNSNLAPLILTAHFDHVGSDLNNNVYNGALDNASGTSFLLELADVIKSYGKPERDIIFVGFNAEEFGCIGSDKFVTKYLDEIKNGKAINFDMIGGSKGTPLGIMALQSDTDRTPFISSTIDACNEMDIPYLFLAQNSSDHIAFRQNSIDAYTFCDSDMSKIHTPDDDVEYINPDSIQRCFNITSEEVINFAFGGNPFIFYYNDIFYTSALALSLILVLLVIIKKSNR